MEHMTKFCQLWRPTYLPPRAPQKAAPKGAGLAGEVAQCQYHGRFCFCCAHALMCGFQYKSPPSPLAIWKFSARERANLPRALRARPQPPPSATKRLLWAADGHKTGGYQKNRVTFSRAPAYLPTCRMFRARFFACPLLRDSKIKRFVALVWSMLALTPVKKSTALLQTTITFVPSLRLS